MKKCTKCDTNKDLSDFNKTKRNKDGYHTICKVCTKENKKKFYLDNKINLSRKAKNHYNDNKDVIKERVIKYYNDNKNIINEKNKKYREDNPEKIKQQKREEYLRNRVNYLEYQKKYRENNPEKVNKLKRDWNKRNPHVVAWRSTLKSVLKRMNKVKDKNTIDILGYSPLELKEHIETLFTDGMNWDNYGEWHVDHIIPVSSFDKDVLTSVVNALSNLQPLWATTREINGVIYEGNLNKGS